MPRAGVSRAHLSSQEDEDDGPEVVIQPSPARPRRSLKNKTLKVRHKLMEVDDHDPLGRFIWDAFKKVENPETMSDTQRDILVNKYKSISLQNRQKFIEQVLHCLKIVLLFLAENEKGRNKKESDYKTN